MRMFCSSPKLECIVIPIARYLHGLEQGGHKIETSLPTYFLRGDTIKYR